MNDLLEKIKSRGYWKVNIKPMKFKEDLINTPAECKEIIQEVQVRLRGWYYPYFSYNNPPTANLDYIEMCHEWSLCSSNVDVRRRGRKRDGVAEPGLERAFSRRPDVALEGGRRPVARVD